MSKVVRGLSSDLYRSCRDCELTSITDTPCHVISPWGNLDMRTWQKRPSLLWLIEGEFSINHSKALVYLFGCKSRSSVLANVCLRPWTILAELEPNPPSRSENAMHWNASLSVTCSTEAAWTIR